MLHSNTTLSVTRRNPYSPDLWIPYVMIGASCVTFLAVHFWCYHKRNRERYLRQMDEKRVKSGLMERRRIATLIQEKYHTELGVNKSNTDIHLSEIYCDNCVDSVTEDNESCNQNTKIAPHYSDDGVKTDMSSSVIPNVTKGASSLAYCEGESKSVTNSQTWPLVADRKTMPYNAHIKYGPESKTSDGSIRTLTAKRDSSHTIDFTHSKTKSDKKCRQIAADSRLVDLEAPTTTELKGSNAQKSEYKLQNGIVESSQMNAFTSFSSPASHPRVFYTSISSSHSTQYSLAPLFKPTRSKRRYDGSPVEDQYRISDLIHNKWNCSRENESKQVHQLPFKLCRAYTENSKGSVREHSDFSHFNQTGGLSPGLGGREAKSLPTIGVKPAYDTFICCHTNPDCRRIPRTDLRYNHYDKLPGSHCDLDNAPTEIIGVCHENPVHYLGGSRIKCPESEIRSGVETEVSSTSIHLQNHLTPQNNTTAMQDSSSLNIISKATGTVRTEIHESDAIQTCLSSSNPVDGSQIQAYSTHSSVYHDRSEGGVINDFNFQTRVTPDVQIPEQKAISSMPRSISLHTNTIHSYRNRADIKRIDALHADLKFYTGKLDRQTPRLRTLDPGLVFQHTQRVSGVKSD